MIQGKQVFTYVDSKVGVTQDGEKYFAINVMTKGSHKSKLSFITKNEGVINKLSQMKFIDFQDIVLIVEFKRLINQNRYSYWNCELIGIGNNNGNS